MSGLAVLHCAETVKGGIATYLRELLPLQMASFGAGRVAVVVPESQRAELPLPDGITLLSYPDRHRRAGNAVSLAAAVFRHWRALRPEVVHVHSTFAGATVRPLAALLAPGSRVVYCAHGWAWDRPMAPLVRRGTMTLERVLAFLSAAVVCISDHERRTAVHAGLPASRLRVVRNGVAAERPRAAAWQPAWPGEGLRLLFVGRFDRQKGADVFCQALAGLAGRACGLMAGDAVLGDAVGLAFPANVKPVGWVDSARLEALFDSADALVVPSRWEGFGLIAAEGMRAGLPVIATRVGGLAEIVVPGETGLLVPPDDPEALREALAALDGAALEVMGAAGRRRFEALFTMDRVHAELCHVYGALRVPDEPASGRCADLRR